MKEMNLIKMNWPRYIPGIPRIPGEYYNSFEALKTARQDLFEGKETSKYHIEYI